jgi:hypothetical protein
MRETNGRAAIEAVDLLVWEVVTASGRLAQGPEGGLARLLREGAATALAGVAAACREDSREAGLAALGGVLAVLRRLGTWLDLAERFGDLDPEHALAALEAQGRAMSAIDELAAVWRGERAADEEGEPPGTLGEAVAPPVSLEIALPAAVAGRGGRGGGEAARAARV